MSDLLTFTVLLASACALVALAVLGYAIWSTVRASNIPARVRLIERIQGQWQSPLLRDDAVAGRVVDLITTPVVRQDFRLTLTITGSPLQDAADFAGDATSIRVAVQAEFDFANLSSKPITMSLRQARADGLMRGRTSEVASLSIDGVEHEPSAITDPEKSVEIEIPPGEKRKMRINSAYFGTLPYIALFPQNIPVRGTSEIRLVSQVRDRTALVVTGLRDCVRYDEDWWDSQDQLDYHLPVPAPLFPGDAILLAVGV